MGSGEICGFIGPNGAGKTTTMRILATLDLPDEGDALLEGHSILVEPRYARARIGFMSDTFHPYANLDVLEFLDFFARAYGLRGRERIRTVASVASFCGLMDFRHRPATGLSKGMGQRLHLAKTLIHDPALLILDEPAAGLDPHARIEFRELIHELAAAGKGILISSHILSELSESCDAVLVIEQGRKIVSGALHEIARAVQAQRAVHVRFLGAPGEVERFFLVQPHVAEVKVREGGLSFDFEGEEEALADLLARAVAAGLRLVEFRQQDTDLEEIFMRTTRGKLQ
ncbi:MAG: ABC transporter ATP-binding protein [Planctomycetes bacterium]|nr:ABC transporter ATP-binding protein [Planctomycetota bacterium]